MSASGAVADRPFLSFAPPVANAKNWGDSRLTASGLRPACRQRLEVGARRPLRSAG